jgi:hypothetical protein
VFLSLPFLATFGPLCFRSGYRVISAFPTTARILPRPDSMTEAAMRPHSGNSRHWHCKTRSTSPASPSPARFVHQVPAAFGGLVKRVRAANAGPKRNLKRVHFQTRQPNRHVARSRRADQHGAKMLPIPDASAFGFGQSNRLGADAHRPEGQATSERRVFGSVNRIGDSVQTGANAHSGARC